MYNSFDSPLGYNEISNSVKSFHPLKAPRLDGLNDMFYQKNCNIVCGKNIIFSKVAFEKYHIPTYHINIIMCIILKCPNPLTLTRWNSHWPVQYNLQACKKDLSKNNKAHPSSVIGIN